MEALTIICNLKAALPLALLMMAFLLRRNK